MIIMMIVIMLAVGLPSLMSGHGLLLWYLDGHDHEYVDDQDDDDHEYDDDDCDHNIDHDQQDHHDDHHQVHIEGQGLSKICRASLISDDDVHDHDHDKDQCHHQHDGHDHS